MRVRGGRWRMGGRMEGDTVTFEREQHCCKRQIYDPKTCSLFGGFTIASTTPSDVAAIFDWTAVEPLTVLAGHAPTL